MNVALEDCWNTIGVQGDASCPQLERYIHCRNCPVYCSAAARLLDGEQASDDRAHWTRYIAQQRALAERDTHSVVLFRVGAEWLALPTAAFQEIAAPRAIHSLPHRRDGVVLGLANIRGELLVCLSLRHVLGIAAVAVEPTRDKQCAPDERLLVIRCDGHRAVCPVDEVCGVERFHPQQLREVPATLARAAATYTKAVLAWQKKSVGVLDEQLLFHTLERSLSSATAT